MKVHIKTTAVPNSEWVGSVLFLCGATTHFISTELTWVTESEAEHMPEVVTCEDCKSTQGLLELRKLA